MNSPRSQLAALGVAPMTRRQFVATPLGLFLMSRFPDVAATRATHAHPEPRVGVTSEHVLSEERVVAKKKSAKRGYEMAREIPEVADGIYCYCECEKSMGHRSLLACFESDQAIGCGMCREQMKLVYDLHQKGKSLAEIRAACDQEYG